MYGESLAELGLLPDTAENDPALLSDDEFELLFQAIADKLAAHDYAMELMDELNINFNLDYLEMGDDIPAILAYQAHEATPAHLFASM
jgi:ATP:corrinoid adenosyltransferase